MKDHCDDPNEGRKKGVEDGIKTCLGERGQLGFLYQKLYESLQNQKLCVLCRRVFDQGGRHQGPTLLGAKLGIETEGTNNRVTSS